MPVHLLIAGGGIAGLTSALALAGAGHRIDVFEQAEAFAEVGAGIQLGPNVTRRLRALGLGDALARIAAVPSALVVRSAHDGAELARMPLGDVMLRRYGAPYCCAHRADLHGLLLAAVRQIDDLRLHRATRIAHVAARDDGVSLRGADERSWDGDGVVGADGLWSVVRSGVADAAPAPPRTPGHTAWRALAAMAALPPALRRNEVCVWLGPRLHAVAYPVRGGDALNVVVLAESAPAGDARDWDQQTSLAALQAATGRTGGSLPQLLEAMPDWRAWTLADRPPLAGPQQMARGRIALVGDAAHPMLPYLAQGAGMAIEDALALAEAVGEQTHADAVPAAFAHYAQQRWQRNAHVQARALRNAAIFHATGALRVARDAALRIAGARLLDVPWLFAG